MEKTSHTPAHHHQSVSDSNDVLAQAQELISGQNITEQELTEQDLAESDTELELTNKPRKGPDRRKSVVDLRNDDTGLERRRGPGRRRTDFAKSAEEGEMSPEQFLFIMAVDAYKRVNQKPFPTWTEVLEVIRKLGYRKTMASELQLPNADDWTEAPDAVAFVPKESKESDNNQILDED